MTEIGMLLDVLLKEIIVLGQQLKDSKIISIRGLSTKCQTTLTYK